MAGHKGPKPVQRYMSEGQRNTIAVCVSMYLKVKGRPRMVGGPDLAHGLHVENPCHKASYTQAKEVEACQQVSTTTVYVIALMSL